MSYAVYRLASRNETRGNFKATDEELLQELIDELKREFEKDLRTKKQLNKDEDYRVAYPLYTKRIKLKAEKFKSVNSGFRKLACMPTFMLGMVMASRVRRHFVHAPWFKAGSLVKMVDVHGAVSAYAHIFIVGRGDLTFSSVQFLSQFIIDGIEMLERIANPDAPPLDLTQITNKREEVEYSEPDERLEVLASLDDMEKAFMRGRGNLERWTLEVLEAIDKCFRTYFMSGDEPIPQLFFPYDDQGIALFNEYSDAVDAVLQEHAGKIPTYAREYFTYFTIWEKRDYAFPVPLATSSVIECLHKMACRVRKGMIEVSHWE